MAAHASNNKKVWKRQEQTVGVRVSEMSTYITQAQFYFTHANNVVQSHSKQEKRSRKTTVRCSYFAGFLSDVKWSGGGDVARYVDRVMFIRKSMFVLLETFREYDFSGYPSVCRGVWAPWPSVISVVPQFWRFKCDFADSW